MNMLPLPGGPMYAFFIDAYVQEIVISIPLTDYNLTPLTDLPVKVNVLKGRGDEPKSLTLGGNTTYFDEITAIDLDNYQHVEDQDWA